MVKIESATAAEVFAVASRMRDKDVTEFLATSRAANKAELVEALVQRFGDRGEVMCAYAGTTPVAIGALIEHRPNVASLLFFATDLFPLVAFPLTRWIRRELFPRHKAVGIHRIECVSIDGHDAAHRWIDMLGLKHEATLRGFGKGGETFQQFAWVSDDVR